MHVTFTAAADIFGGLAQKTATNMPKLARFDDPTEDDDEDESPEEDADSKSEDSDARTFAF